MSYAFRILQLFVRVVYQYDDILRERGPGNQSQVAAT